MIKVVFSSLVMILASQLAVAETITIENFETGTFSWETQRSMNDKAPDYTVLQEDNNFFLRGAPAPGAKSNIIYKRNSIRTSKTPILSWRWRALALPKVGKSDRDVIEDCAGTVYVFFKRGLSKRVLKYCWSTHPAKKEWITSPSSTMLWKTRVKVLRHGGPLNEWVTESVDLERDYKAAFKRKMPGKSGGIGILTDTDQTNSLSSADYDDFLVSSRQPNTPAGKE